MGLAAETRSELNSWGLMSADSSLDEGIDVVFSSSDGGSTFSRSLDASIGDHCSRVDGLSNWGCHAIVQEVSVFCFGKKYFPARKLIFTSCQNLFGTARFWTFSKPFSSALSLGVERLNGHV